MNILEDLWFGNLLLCEKNIEQNSEYAVLLKELCRLDKQITVELSETGKKLFCRHEDIQCQMGTLSDLETFKIGFRFGVKLMLEVLHDEQSS